MRVCAVAALFWHAASERDDEMVMLQRKQTSSLTAGFRGTDQWNLCNTKVTSRMGGHEGVSVDELGFTIPTPEAEELRYWKVGKVGGQDVDLRLTNMSEYEPFNPSQNGRKGCFGVINVGAGKHVQIQYALVATGTDTLISALNLKQNFTVVDFDRSKVKKKDGSLTVEQVWAKDFANAGDTRLEESDRMGEWYVFDAPENAIEIPNPEDQDLDDLNETQLDATLSLSYDKMSAWEIIFKADLVEGDGNGRNFLWAGETSSCDVAPECMCTPPERMAAVSALDHYLKWDMCGEDEPVTGNGHVLRYPNVGKMKAGDGTMAVGEQSVDLIVDNMTAYDVNNPENNGRSGCLGIINIKAPGSVSMKFTLVLSGTDTPVPVDTNFPLTYDFNIFDFDQSATGKMQEVIGVANFSKLAARPPGILKRKNEETGITWLHTTSKAVENPVTDIRSNLTSEQIQSSFSVSYRAVSSWEIHFEAKGLHKYGRSQGRNFLFSGESCASWRFYECSCPADKKIYRRRAHK